MNLPFQNITFGNVVTVNSLYSVVLPTVDSFLTTCTAIKMNHPFQNITFGNVVTVNSLYSVVLPTNRFCSNHMHSN